MDEDEINQWYDEEKEKIIEESLLEKEKSGDSKKSEIHLRKRTAEAKKKYNKLMEKYIKQKARKDKFNKKIKEIKRKLHLEKKYEKKETES